MPAERVKRDPKVVGKSTDMDDCRISFASFDKLFVCEFPILVQVHVSKNLIHTLGRVYQRYVTMAGGRGTFSGVSSSGGSVVLSPIILYIDWTISSISSYDTVPSLSMSYSSKAPRSREL